jgi:hypothetical protein
MRLTCRYANRQHVRNDTTRKRHTCGPWMSMQQAEMSGYQAKQSLAHVLLGSLPWPHTGDSGRSAHLRLPARMALLPNGPAATMDRIATACSAYGLLSVSTKRLRPSAAALVATGYTAWITPLGAMLTPLHAAGSAAVGSLAT